MKNYEKIKLWKIIDCEECQASKGDCCYGAGKCEKTLRHWLLQECE